MKNTGLGYSPGNFLKMKPCNSCLKKMQKLEDQLTIFELCFKVCVLIAIVAIITKYCNVY